MSSIKKIKKQMERLNLTQKQIAQHIEQPESLVISWINGKKDIPFMMLWKICDLLNLDLHEIIKKNYKKSFK